MRVQNVIVALALMIVILVILLVFLGGLPSILDILGMSPVDITGGE